ncbi:MAG: TetR/AcrR family transcriptional regulator, partial [Bacteroidota bacterium]
MEAKKLHIIQNVGKLYLKFGIRSVTMDNVSAEFGISKKTLYQYFSDKEDLVSQVIDYFLQNPLFDFKTEHNENAIDSLFDIRDHVAHILKFYNNNIEFELKKVYPQLYKRVYDAKRRRIYDNTIDNITEGIKQGLYREGLNPEFIAKIQVGRMLYTLNPDYQIFEEHEVSSLDLFDKIMSYHMHAICTKKGLDYYQKQLNRIQN